MSSVLQSYSITKQKKTRKPLEHYTGVPSASAFDLDPSRTIALNYIDPSNVLPNSDAESAVVACVGARRSFVPMDQLVETPVSISINKAPKSPLNWSVTYLFPQGELSSYLANSFSSVSESFARDTVGILSWGMTIDTAYSHYGKVEAGVMQIKGFQFGDASIRINVTTDFEIADFDNINNIPTEGLDLNINQHTVVANVEATEDTSLTPTYRYDWTFGVL